MTNVQNFQRISLAVIMAGLGACAASGPENVSTPAKTSGPEKASDNKVTTESANSANNDKPTPAASANAVTNGEKPSPEKPIAVKPPVQPPADDEEEDDEGGVEGGIEGGLAGPIPGLADYNSGADTSRPDVPIPFTSDMKQPSKISGPSITEGIASPPVGVWAALCILKEDGTVTECKATQSILQFDAKLIKNLQAQKYTPVIYKGKPKRVFFTFSFKLPK